MQYRTISLMLGIGLAGATGLLYAIAATVLMSSFSELEHQSTQRHVQRAQQTLDNALASLSTTTGDYARWDDTYQYVQDHNSAYREANLIDATFTSFGLSLLAVVNQSRQIVYAQEYDLAQEALVELSSEVRPQLVTAPLAHHTQLDAETVGLLNSSQGPILLASRPIVTSEGKGPIQGNLVMGQRLNREKLDDLEALTQLSLEVRSLNQANLPKDFVTAKTALLVDPDASTIPVQPLDRNTIAGYRLLYDLNQKPAFILRVSLPREIYQQGRIRH